MPRPRRTTRRTIRRTYRKKKSSATTKRIRKVVKRELHKQIEDKLSIDQMQATIGGTNLVLTPSTSTFPYALDLVPTIQQGTSKFQRVGQRVRIRSYKIDFQINLSGAAVTSGTDVPMNIYWAVLRTRQDSDTLTAGDLNLLFYNGNASTTQFLSGSGYAACNRLNTDYFQIFAHNFKRPIKLGLANMDTAATGGIANWANNDYKSFCRFTLDLTKHMSKRCIFALNSNEATNNHMWMVFYVQKANLDANITNWDPPGVFPVRSILFEDA